MAQIVNRAAKNALESNPNQFLYPMASDINITVRGSDIYWAITAIMGASTLAFLGFSLTQPRRDRLFYHITALITITATISYFTMAANLGYAATAVEFQRSNPVVRGVYREVFYVRYIDWVITTPLLLTDLLLTAGVPWQTIVYTLVVDEVMVVTGLVGALVTSSYKWGYFVIAMLALFVVAHNVVWVGQKHARTIGPSAVKAFRVCGIWTIFLWFIYPIAWGLCEGGNVISPDSEAIFYGALDVLAKPGFGLILLLFHRNLSNEELGLSSRDYEHGPNGQHHGGAVYNTNGNHNGNNHSHAGEEAGLGAGAAGVVHQNGHANGAATNGATSNGNTNHQSNLMKRLQNFGGRGNNPHAHTNGNRPSSGVSQTPIIPPTADRQPDRVSAPTTRTEPNPASSAGVPAGGSGEKTSDV